MRAVVVAGAVGQHELVRDEHRHALSAQCSKRSITCAMPRMSTTSSRVIAGHVVRGPSRAHVGGHLPVSALSRALSPTIAPLEHGVIGAASLRLVDRRCDRVGAAGALERLVQRLDVGIQIALGLEDVALNRHGLAMLAQVESRIDDVVMPAPGTGQNRRVARPGDARKVDDRAVREHRAALDRGRRDSESRPDCCRADGAAPNATGRRAGSCTRAAGRAAIVVDYFVERLAVLPLQIDFGGRARRVEAIDFRQSHNARDRRRDIDMARIQLDDVRGAHPAR